MEGGYSKFFNLSMNPFGETPDSRFYFESQTHAAALKKLEWVIQQGKGFSLLSAEVGMGKTLISRMLLKNLQHAADTALVVFPQLSGTEIFGTISEEFGLQVNSANATIKEQLELLKQFLLKNASAQRRTVLVIDEAQSLSLGALEIVRCLGNFESESEKLLQVVLMAQPELLIRLRSPELRQLAQRIGINVKLEPLTKTETEKYIRHRLEVAGSDNMVRFDPKAIELIHEASEGIPRKINKHCEALLLAAQNAKIRLIDQRFTRILLEKPRRRWFSWQDPGKTSEAGL